jgi:hypothetical protein
MRAPFLVVLLAGGCAHSVVVESTPPGAAVIRDGVEVGTTSCALQEQTGRNDLVTLELQRGPQAARFAYDKSGMSNEAVLAAGGAACALCGVGGAGFAALLLVVPAALLVGANPAFGLGLLIGAYAAYTLGLLMVGYAPQVFVLGVGQGARKGPDRIHVDFSTPAPALASEPADLLVPMVGRTARPARAKGDAACAPIDAHQGTARPSRKNPPEGPSASSVESQTMPAAPF